MSLKLWPHAKCYQLLFQVTIGEAYSKLMRFRSEFDNSLDLRRSAAFRRPVERILESSENALKFLHASTLEIINRLKGGHFSGVVQYYICEQDYCESHL